MSSDPKALRHVDRILERLRDRLVEYVAAKGLGDRTDDVVQETLTVLWTKYAHVTTEADLVPLAYTICRFKMLEARRSPGGKVHGPLDRDAVLPARGASVEQRLERQAERQRLIAAISRLGERCKRLIRLRLQERSTAQIAALMGASEATVYVWEHRCRKSLFHELA